MSNPEPAISSVEITFISKCGYAHMDYNFTKLPGKSDLTSIHGFTDPVRLADYFHDSDNLGMFTGGICRLIVQGSKVFLHQTYYCTRTPTKEETDRLWDYTRGQNSDGWGEGFEQRPVPGSKSVVVSPHWGPEKPYAIIIGGLTAPPKEPMVKLEVSHGEYSLILGLLRKEIQHCELEPMMDRLRRATELIQDTKGKSEAEIAARGAEMERYAAGMAEYYKKQMKASKALESRFLKEHGIA